MRNPRFHSDAKPHRVSTDTITSSQSANGCAHSVFCSRRMDYIPSEFVKPVILSDRNTSALPAFRNLVGVIIRNSSNPKMAWIDAGWIVAMMQYAHPFRNWTKMKNPRNAVTADGGRPFPPDHLSITKGVFVTSPKPTVIGLLNFGPESFWKCITEFLRLEIKRCNLWLHNKLVLLCRALGRFSVAEAF